MYLYSTNNFLTYLFVKKLQKLSFCLTMLEKTIIYRKYFLIIDFLKILKGAENFLKSPKCEKLIDFIHIPEFGFCQIHNKLKIYIQYC